MAILAHDIHNPVLLPRGRGVVATPLFRDACLYLMLSGAGLGVLVAGALAASAFGWRGAMVAIACYGLIALATLAGLARHAHPPRFGLANAITLGRAGLTTLILGVAGESLLGGMAVLGEGVRWALAFAALLILALDGLDGQAARRNGMASPFGAWFDMEADALFILAISLLAMAAGAVGAWVLLCGGMRYVFLLAGHFDERLTAALPPSLRRKSIYVAQAGAPIVALTPLCPPPAAAALCGAAFLLVLYSFGADCALLMRPRLEPGMAAPNSA
jgi:phosphatidylglycerophosphate synthase